MFHFLGIDVGKSGAYALINEKLTEAEAWDFPKSLEFLAEKIQKLQAENNIGICCLEKANARPGQGVTSMFNFGVNYGVWQGVLTACHIPYFICTPHQWQRGVFDAAPRKKDTKLLSLSNAKRRFPMVDLSRKKDHGKADALNMALWARKKFFVEREI